MLGDDLDTPETRLGDGLVTDGAGSAVVIRKSQVVEDAGPAEHVTTLTHLGSSGREQADGTRGEVVTGHAEVDLLDVAPVHHHIRISCLDTVVLVLPHHELTVCLEIVSLVILGSSNLLLMMMLLMALLLMMRTSVTTLEVEQMIVVAPVLPGVLLPAARGED